MADDLSVLVVCLGDLLLDVIVRLDERLSPGADARAETRLCAGGQAANVAAWAVELGAQGRFVGKRGDDEAALAAAALARAEGAHLSVDLSAWTRIRDFGATAFRERLEELQPDVVFGNEQEWRALGDDVAATVRVVKRGARGFLVGDEDFPPPPGEVVDSTGAGDALAAGFLVGGAELAREAAARCVARLGAMP